MAVIDLSDIESMSDEELLEYLFQECKNPEELKKLFIDLSPFSKEGYAESRPLDIIQKGENSINFI